MTVVPAPPHQEAGLPSPPTAREEAVPHPPTSLDPRLPSPVQEWVPNPLDRVLFLTVFLLLPPPSSGPCDGGLDSSLVPWKWPQEGQFLQPRGPLIPWAFLCYMFLAMLSLHCGAQTLVAKHGLWSA